MVLKKAVNMIESTRAAMGMINMLNNKFNNSARGIKLCESFIFEHDHEYDIKNDIVCSVISEINIIEFIKNVFNNRCCYLVPCATFDFNTIINGLLGIHILQIILSVIYSILTYGMFVYI